MTKLNLLHEIDLAIDNNACLVLKAGDYFTDYIKIIYPATISNFIGEVEDFAVGIIEEHAYIKIHSIDIVHGGTREQNEYYIYDAKAVAPEEVEALASLVNAVM